MNTSHTLPKSYPWAIYPLIFFVIASVGDIIGRWLNSSTMDFIFKPLLIPCLLIWFWASIFPNRNKFKWLVSFALLFSWMGDIALLFAGNIYFLLGLSSFLVAQVLYILAYFQPTQKQFRQTILFQKTYWILPYLVFWVVFYAVLYPNLHHLQLPVFLYSMVLIGMGIMALNRYGFVSRESFRDVWIGAIFFIISDSCIAFNQFLFAQQWAWSGIVVMMTYIIAQYLIIKGSIEQIRQEI